MIAAIAAHLTIAGAAFVPPGVPVVARTRASQPAMLADWQKPVFAALAAATLVFSPMDPAHAGRSGGRVGGRAPSMSRSPTVTRAPSAATRSPSAAPRTTNIYMAPSPMMGGYGYGMGGYGYGGGGSGMGLYLGLSVAEAFLREQQRQAYLQQQLRTQQQLGADQAAIQALQSQLAEQNAKVSALQAQGGAENKNPWKPPEGATAPPAAESEAMMKLQAQLLEQQKQIEALKAGQ